MPRAVRPDIDIIHCWLYIIYPVVRVSLRHCSDFIKRFHSKQPSPPLSPDDRVDSFKRRVSRVYLIWSSQLSGSFLRNFFHKVFENFLRVIFYALIEYGNLIATVVILGSYDRREISKDSSPSLSLYLSIYLYLFLFRNRNLRERKWYFKNILLRIWNLKRKGEDNCFPKGPKSSPTLFSLGTRTELYANVCTRSGGWQAALLEEEYRRKGKRGVVRW